jgi:hypothetical protein
LVFKTSDRVAVLFVADSHPKSVIVVKYFSRYLLVAVGVIMFVGKE